MLAVLAAAAVETRFRGLLVRQRKAIAAAELVSVLLAGPVKPLVVIPVLVVVGRERLA